MAIQNRITEQFLTIQGEGKSLGRQAYFLRLAGCNLWCRWCDSMHSVDPNLFKGRTFPVDYSKIPKNSQLFVITGGEPTLFDLMQLKNELMLNWPNAEIEVESNATLFPDKIVDEFRWNLSPKLKSSQQKTLEQDAKRYQNLARWAEFSKSSPDKVIFKFVITTENDLKEVVELHNNFQIPAKLIYLMAEGDQPESQSLEKTLPLIEFAKSNGFNFSPRLHVMYWGKTRGV